MPLSPRFWAVWECNLFNGALMSFRALAFSVSCICSLVHYRELWFMRCLKLPPNLSSVGVFETAIAITKYMEWSEVMLFYWLFYLYRDSQFLDRGGNQRNRIILTNFDKRTHIYFVLGFGVEFELRLWEACWSMSTQLRPLDHRFPNMFIYDRNIVENLANL